MRRSSDNWISTLAIVRTQLENMATSTENEFLSIGAKLVTFHGNAKEIHETGAEAASLMSNEKIEEAINSLHDLVDKMKAYLTECEQRLSENIANVQNILSFIESACKILKDFNRIIVYLRVLGIRNKIEYAKLEHVDQSFATLTNQVWQQSTIIERSINDFLTNLKRLRTDISEVLSKIYGQEARRRDQAEVIMRSIVSSLDNIVQERNASTEIVSRISRRSEEISRSIGGVVTSIQFHDITRQRIEHVSETLEELKEISDEARFRYVCDLEAAQLRETRSELVAAVNTIISNLGEIVKNVRDVSNDTVGLVGVTDDNGASFLSKLEGDMSAVSTSLRIYQVESDTLIQTISPAADSLESMETHLNDLEKVGETIELVAINALINAEGENIAGPTMGVVAQEIRGVSRELRQRLNEVADVVKVIIRAAADLRNGGSETAMGSESGVDAFTGDLERLFHSVRENNQRSIALLGQMEDTGRGLAERIEETVADITVHEVMSVELGKAIAHLKDVASDTSDLMERGSILDANDILEDSMGRYSMHKERAIHASWLGEAPTEAPIGTDDRAQDEDDTDHDSPGDNVEIF